MSVADKIDLFWWADWFIGDGIITTLLNVVFVMIGVQILVAVLLENRSMLDGPDKIPARRHLRDLLLGLSLGTLLVQARQIPDADSWYAQDWVHYVGIAVIFAAVGIIAWLDYKDAPSHQRRALRSPTVLYRSLCYVVYTYILAATLAAVITDAWSWWLLLLLVPAAAWSWLFFAKSNRGNEYISNYETFWGGVLRERERQRQQVQYWQ